MQQFFAERDFGLDYYAILGVPKDATCVQIDAAVHVEIDRKPTGRWQRLWFSLAGRTPERVSEAHGILSCPASRAEYDRYLAETKHLPRIPL